MRYILWLLFFIICIFLAFRSAPISNEELQQQECSQMLYC